MYQISANIRGPLYIHWKMLCKHKNALLYFDRGHDRYTIEINWLLCLNIIVFGESIKFANVSNSFFKSRQKWLVFFWSMNLFQATRQTLSWKIYARPKSHFSKYKIFIVCAIVRAQILQIILQNVVQSYHDSRDWLNFQGMFDCFYLLKTWCQEFRGESY